MSNSNRLQLILFNCRQAALCEWSCFKCSSRPSFLDSPSALSCFWSPGLGKCSQPTGNDGGSADITSALSCPYFLNPCCVLRSVFWCHLTCGLYGMEQLPEVVKNTNAKKNSITKWKWNIFSCSFFLVCLLWLKCSWGSSSDLLTTS